MESPKAPSRGRGKDEERIPKQDSATRMSEGVTRNPKQVLKNQRDNQGRVTIWTGPLDHKKLRRQRNNSGEREDPAHQNKGAEMQPFKAETDNPQPVAGEDTMQCERDVARSNTRTAMPKTLVSVSPPGEGQRRESEAPCIHASTPSREVQLPEESLASHHAQNTRA